MKTLPSILSRRILICLLMALWLLQGLSRAADTSPSAPKTRPNVLFLLADDLILSKSGCLKQMVEAYAEIGGNVIAAMDVPREQTRRYGIISPGKDDGKLVEVKALVEKPEAEVAPSTVAVIGRYILQPKVFTHLDRAEKGAGGEIQLTDAMARMIGDTPFHGLRFDGERYDCGDKLGFLQANIAFALDRPDMRKGMASFLTKITATL